MMEEWKKVLAWIERFSSHPLTDEDDIAFLAEYDDGSTSTFVIDRWTLERGDHVASIIARKRQEAAQLKPGKISFGKSLWVISLPRAKPHSSSSFRQCDSASAANLGRKRSLRACPRRTRFRAELPIDRIAARPTRRHRAANKIAKLCLGQGRALELALADAPSPH